MQNCVSSYWTVWGFCFPVLRFLKIPLNWGTAIHLFSHSLKVWVAYQFAGRCAAFHHPGCYWRYRTTWEWALSLRCHAPHHAAARYRADHTAQSAGPGQPATSLHLTELTARANTQLPSRNGGNLLKLSLPSLDADSSRGLYEQH